MSENIQKQRFNKGDNREHPDETFNELPQPIYDPGTISRIINDQDLRPQDRPEFMHIGNQLLREPRDLYLQEYFTKLLRERITTANQARYPFYGNTPAKGAAITSGPSICTGILPTGDILRKPLNMPSSGTVFTGSPGTGKSTLARLNIIQRVLAGDLAIVWDIKGTWHKLLHIPILTGPSIVFSVLRFMWSLLQEPSGSTKEEWANRLTNMISQDYSRLSSQRIFRSISQKLLDKCPGKYKPPLKVIIDHIKLLRATSYRDRDTISGLLWVLEDISNHFPGCFEYITSDFPQKLIEQPGRLVIIEDPGLPTEHRNFLIHLLWEYAFTFRRHNPNSRQFKIIFVLEDSTALLDAARDRETPGGVSSLAQNLNLGREMGIEIYPICHSLGQISPKILPNIDSYFVCSLRGDNLNLAMQVLGINAKQAEYMRVNPLGTACALVPGVWPLPVLIGFPKLPEEFE